MRNISRCTVRRIYVLTDPDSQMSRWPDRGCRKGDQVALRLTWAVVRWWVADGGWYITVLYREFVCGVGVGMNNDEAQRSERRG
jgi:hypothetical protein